MRGFIRTLIAFAAGAMTATGAIRTVTNLNDSGAGSLRETIAASAAGDTIQFGVTGTITLTSDQLTVSKNLTITGPGPGSLAITFGGFGRAFWIPSGTVNLSGLTIRDCVEYYGSALLIHAGATVSATNCLIQRNRVYAGGNGIYPIPGAIQSLGSLILTDCTFFGNSGESKYTAAVRGAGGSSLTVQRCTFDSNLNKALCSDGTLNVNNSTFYNSYGIAIDIQGGDSGAITSCTFFRNNEALHRTGLSGSATLRNNLFVRNHHAYSSEAPTALVNVVSQGYNLCDDAADFYLFPLAYRLTEPGDQTGVDPLIDPHGLAYNGGYTGTIALTSGSPAIDKGKAFGLTTDQRGQPRTIDSPEGGPASGGDSTDIGAYEAPTDTLQPSKDLLVTTLADHDDGTCGIGDCTLREAVNRANGVQAYPPLSVRFAPGLAGTLTLDRNLGELVLTRGITIMGPGARVLAVSGGGYIRIFRLLGGTTRLTGLTLREGWQATGNPGTSNLGGAIFTQRDLILEDCAFFGNYAAGVSAETSGTGGSGRGGAIYNAAGSLLLKRCTFSSGGSSGNVAAGGEGASVITPGANGGAGGAAQGGAIYNATGATLKAENCTFHGNSTGAGSGGNSNTTGRAGSGGAAAGGAIYSQGIMTLTGCTVSGNVATGGAGGTARNNPDNDGRAGNAIGGIMAVGGSATLAGTICAANNAGGLGSLSPDVQGAFVSLGFNLIGTSDDSSGITQASDQTGTDVAPINPGLGPLADNGGQTNTLSLLAGSPARDRGHSFQLVSDQRGVTRPVNDPAIPDITGGDGSDIGAVEFLQEGPQSGPTFVVTTLDDHDDGACSYLDGTLREAINASNAAAGPNAIIFAPTIKGTILLESTLPDIASSLSIEGAGEDGSNLTINGANAYRVFTFTGGTSELSGLNIDQGSVIGLVRASAAGGGIFNQATLKLTDCNLVGNRALGGSAFTTGSGGGGRGGAIFNQGSLTLERCTISDGVAQGGHGASSTLGSVGNGGTGSGGAIFNDLTGVLTLTACTLARNSGTGGTGGNGGSSGGDGGTGHGGIFNQGTLTMTSCTLSLNNGRGGSGGSGTTLGTGGSGYGGIFQHATNGSNSVTNSIVAGNLASGNGNAPDIAGTFYSTGHNLIGIGTGGTGFSQQGDQMGSAAAPINARMGADLSIGLSSPALDKGRSAGLAWDGRGMPRRMDSILYANAPGGDGTDIGAFEYNPFQRDTLNATDVIDTDWDQLPDDYEVFHGLNPFIPDAAVDSDDDGANNLSEWESGTNPRDASSVLQVLAVEYLGDSVRILFGPVIPYWPYTIEYKNDLSGPQWLQPVGFPTFPSHAFSFTLTGVGELVDPTTSGIPRRFYRVRTGF